MPPDSACASAVASTLSRRALGVLLLCLVCSGAVVMGLIRGQMVHLAYAQMRVLFESDLRNLRTFLQGQADEMSVS